MSAYLTFATPMTDRECLLAALADLGFDGSKVESAATPLALTGYAGDARAQSAHVVIRRGHLGNVSNDLGFLETPTGFQEIVSDYDNTRFGRRWLDQLHARYLAHWAAKQARLNAEEQARAREDGRRVVEAQRQAIHDRARKLGYLVQESREGERVRLVLVKRVY